MNLTLMRILELVVCLCSLTSENFEAELVKT
jgi:hypothetical protein